MRIYSSTRTPRRTAFAVLWVWLFSVAAGVANGCLLETPQSHADVVKVAALAHGDDHAAEHGDESHALISQPPCCALRYSPFGLPGRLMQPCLKACDDGKQALTKAQAGVDQTDPGPAPLVMTLWAVSAARAVVSRQRYELQLPLVGPPLRVRYARLAL